MDQSSQIAKDIVADEDKDDQDPSWLQRSPAMPVVKSAELLKLERVRISSSPLSP
jgi:hypothetical protein